MPTPALDRLLANGFRRGDMLAVAVAHGVGLGLATETIHWGEAAADPFGVIRDIEAALRPRWVWWSIDTAAAFTAAGVRVAACWDIAAVHRLLFGGWRADTARIWSWMHDLPAEAIPIAGQLDLAGGQGDDPGQPVRFDGYLNADWVAGGWADEPNRLALWASAAWSVAALQQTRLEEVQARGAPLSTARSESAAELLCAELMHEGLPVDIARAEQLIASLVGPRARNDRDAAEARARRDAAVLQHIPASTDIDLRNPAQVKNLLRRVGIEVTDTRAWRLETLRDQHPVVEALLQWRKAERIATTYGYSWLDEHVGADGRLRGAWSGTDGAAGRMTAQAGLHNMPVDMREIVAADPGHVFVRADLGQIEPRVLAAVSGDAALARATADDDLYAPVATRLGVERAVAKVAVLAAMYGQTSGVAGQALRGLDKAYPVAMRFLQDADETGQAGHDLRTYGGRRVRMWHPAEERFTDASDASHGEAADVGDGGARSVAAARGRYARNAMVQGAAAELFKVWAAVVRSRAAVFDARIVLCLHDELLVHTPEQHGERVAELLGDCLQQATRIWAPDTTVRFVADTSVIRRWSDAKP
jgi:DNA polymerase-1